MRVKCIKTGYNRNLTIGKTYEVISIYHDGDYRIINDDGVEDWYFDN